ncbi:MAG: transcriptional regulator PpsR [Rhodobacteraceae bacterium]|jgi:transcriptional regulator PpsR|nr:transcriptional regulator PpsR [Alphaproteobacteria bacterium]MBT8475344.1 transcriptional regulator PpsR [Alphaproteobacteria bacterium]NNF70681.1 transcriptional regulator PpsR [Paracoccaceae bacterium]NNK67784.1 transcriptional regulator PpsR [Paracoccaceae bacterium]
MRSEDFQSRRSAAREIGLTDDNAASHGDGKVSTRGTRYWNSGSIPLIGPDVLGDIIATAGDIGIVISDVGQVLSVLVNPTHPHFGNLSHWVGNDIRDFLTVESVPKLEAQLTAFSSGTAPARGMELNHSDSGDWEFPVRYTLHQIGPDGALLMLGRDLRPIAEMQQQLVRAQMALERDYEAQREFDTRFRVLMDSIPDPVVFVSMETGKITDINAPACALLGGKPSDLGNNAFAQEFETRKKGELIDTLASLALSDTAKPIEVTSRRTRKPLLMSPVMFRAAGERFLLCRLENADEAEQTPDALTENLNGLYQEGVDAIVFTDRDGVIQAANEAFLNLADVAHVTLVRGKSLADYLARGSIDSKVLIENATRAGHMSLYATKLSSEFGAETAVEISATYLNDRANPALVFVIRDASRVDAVRRPGVSVSDDGMRNVMELVGSATLKDIVSDTTDVVEKMCIETAVELTRNNRVAAAEMLGLSRQSLYVKLRKYGLLSKD